METAAVQVAALAIAGAAVYTDTKQGIIPNKMTFPAVAVGIGANTALGGWDGLGFAAAGAALGFVLFLLPFLFGGMGAGDVKLLAALGAFIGPTAVLGTFFFSALLGGLIALAVLIRNSGIQMVGLAAFSGGVRGLLSLSHGGTRLGFPFASAIFFGLFAALLVR